MKKIKIAFTLLLIVTVAYVLTSVYCYAKIKFFPPQPHQEDGVWVDPSPFALAPYSRFLQYDFVGYIVLTALWIALTAFALKQRRT